MAGEDGHHILTGLDLDLIDLFRLDDFAADDFVHQTFVEIGDDYRVVKFDSVDITQHVHSDTAVCRNHSVGVLAADRIAGLGHVG